MTEYDESGAAFEIFLRMFQMLERADEKRDDVSARLAVIERVIEKEFPELKADLEKMTAEVSRLANIHIATKTMEADQARDQAAWWRRAQLAVGLGGGTLAAIVITRVMEMLTKTPPTGGPMP